MNQSTIQQDVIEFRKVLEEEDNSLVRSINQHVESKRVFLGILLTISSAIIAGLFVLITSENYGSCFKELAIGSSGLFAVSIIVACTYLTIILSGESLSLDRRRQFIINSRNGLAGITNEDSFRKWGESNLKEAEKTKQKVKFSQEKWFVTVSILFIFAFLWLLFVISNTVGLIEICSIQ